MVEVDQTERGTESHGDVRLTGLQQDSHRTSALNPTLALGIERLMADEACSVVGEEVGQDALDATRPQFDGTLAPEGTACARPRHCDIAALHGGSAGQHSTA